MPILTSFGGMTSSPTSFHIFEHSEKMIGISRGKLTENLH